MRQKKVPNKREKEQNKIRFEALTELKRQAKKVVAEQNKSQTAAVNFSETAVTTTKKAKKEKQQAVKSITYNDIAASAAKGFKSGLSPR